MFHFHSLLIYFSIYIVTSKGFSQFCNSHAYSILLACAGSMLYAIPSLLDIYTIYAHCFFNSILQPRLPPKFARLVLCPFIIPVCHLLIQILVLFLALLSVFATPSFSQLCSLSAFFFTYILYFSIQV